MQKLNRMPRVPSVQHRMYCNYTYTPALPLFFASLTMAGHYMHQDLLLRPCGLSLTMWGSTALLGARCESAAGPKRKLSLGLYVRSLEGPLPRQCG